MAANLADRDMSEINQCMRVVNATKTRTPTTYDRQLMPEVPVTGTRQVYDRKADADGPPCRSDSLVEAVMCKLISSPNEGLDVRMNGLLLQICEAYRNSKDREARLQRQLDAQLESHHAVARKMQQSQSRWNEERQNYGTEIRRLEELLLARDKHGLAEVAFARNDSLLPQCKHKDQSPQIKAAADDGLQNIFGMLERARHGQDQAYNSQRATFTHRAASPSVHMRRISQLISKKSMTNIHADLPFGSPPDLSISTVAEATSLESRNNVHKRVGRHAQKSESYEPEPNASLSENDTSTFSVIDRSGSVVSAIGAQQGYVMEDADDHAALQRVARMLVHHHEADLASMIQRLAQPVNAIPRNAKKQKASLFPRRNLLPSAHENLTTIMAKFCSELMPATSTQSSHLPYIHGVSHATVESLPVFSIVENIHRVPSVMAQASSFLQKLRPLLHGDTAMTQRCQPSRFSLEAGDDTIALSAPLSNIVATSNSKTLRKSISLSTISPKFCGTILSSSTLPVKRRSKSSGLSPCCPSLAIREGGLIQDAPNPAHPPQSSTMKTSCV